MMSVTITWIGQIAHEGLLDLLLSQNLPENMMSITLKRERERASILFTLHNRHLPIEYHACQSGAQYIDSCCSSDSAGEKTF